MMRTLTTLLSTMVTLALVLPAGAAIPGSDKLPPTKASAIKKAQAQFGPPEGFGPPAGMMGPGNFGPGGSGETMGPGSFGPGGSRGSGESGMMDQQGPGGFGPGGSGPDGMMGPEGEGPDEDQIQKMQIKGMFQGAKMAARGMAQGMKMMKSMLPKLQKQGITVPQELHDAIASADAFVAYMQKIKSADDIPDADAFMDKMSEMADIGSVLQEWGPRLGDLMRMGQMIKEADRRMKQMATGVKRAKTQAAKSKVDLSNLIAELDTNAEAARQALADAKAKTDPDEKQDAIETFFDNVQNVFDSIKLIDDLKNISRAKADWTRQIKQNDALVKQLQKKKLDTSELAAKQGELKAKLTELEQALKQKPIDQETVVGILDEVKELQSEFGDIKDTLLGTQSELPQIKADPYKAPKFDFGAFEQFKKEAPATNGESEEESVE